MTDDARYTGVHSRLTREQIAELEVGKTIVSKPLRTGIVILFLLTVLSVPVIQQAIEIKAGFASQGCFTLPKCYSFITFPDEMRRAFNKPNVHGLWHRTQAANNNFLSQAKAYEKSLQDESFLAQATIPHTQEITSRFMGLGNEEVYLGRDGWLFYQPGVGYLTNDGFLNPDILRARARKGHAGEEMQPDPLKAIVNFRDQLKAHGIRLIVLPAPIKPMIEPEHLSARYTSPLPIPLQNPSYGEFLRGLDAAGVDYLDVSGMLAEEKQRTSKSQFLFTDTHWLPDAMELTAKKLADKINSLGPPGGAPVSYVRAERSVTNIGDIANMLKLPSSSDLYPRQTVTIHPVSKADGTPWTADPRAAILVLGDSFSNIYSLDGMGWGNSAGFVEQLGYNLRQPLDSILRNDAGAYATRDILARDLAKGHDRLAGKRIVVWEFAMRELSVGDWKMIDLTKVKPAAAPAATSATAPAAKPAAEFYAPQDGSAPVHVTATVDAVSKFPSPGSVPYKDHVFAVTLRDVSGAGIPSGSRALVYLWSMRNNILTKASQWKAGDRVTLDLKSWNDVSDQYDRFNRSEPEDESIQLQPPCWGEPAH